MTDAKSGKPPKQPTRPANQEGADQERDEVETDSRDSFPASDPPSFTPIAGPGKPPKDGKP